MAVIEERVNAKGDKSYRANTTIEIDADGTANGINFQAAALLR